LNPVPRRICARERGVRAHLLYWHEHYLAQSKAILSGKTYPLPPGRFADLNARAAEKMAGLSSTVFVRRFRTANRRFRRLALANDPRAIAFRIQQGSQPWKLSDLIPAAEGHIRNHLRKLKKEFSEG
jgi:hypothetical protein